MSLKPVTGNLSGDVGVDHFEEGWVTHLPIGSGQGVEESHCYALVQGLHVFHCVALCAEVSDNEIE